MADLRDGAQVLALTTRCTLAVHIDTIITWCALPQLSPLTRAISSVRHYHSPTTHGSSFQHVQERSAPLTWRHVRLYVFSAISHHSARVEIIWWHFELIISPMTPRPCCRSSFGRIHFESTNPNPRSCPWKENQNQSLLSNYRLVPAIAAPSDLSRTIFPPNNNCTCELSLDLPSSHTHSGESSHLGSFFV